MEMAINEIYFFANHLHMQSHQLKKNGLILIAKLKIKNIFERLYPNLFNPFYINYTQQQQPQS